MNHGLSQSTHIKCKKCFLIEEISEFYVKGVMRYDPVCIECRRKERKEKYQAKKKTTPSKRIIEPKIIQKKYLGANNDTSALVQKCDFNDMEKVYGKMTITQKHEAIQRLNDFITLLREGYGEMLGCEVYVRKD